MAAVDALPDEVFFEILRVEQDLLRAALLGGLELGCMGGKELENFLQKMLGTGLDFL